MKDTVSLLVDPSPFDTDEDRFEVVAEMVRQLIVTPPIKLKPISSFSDKHGYYIEFPLYTSFPSNVIITSENFQTKDHCWINITVKEKPLSISWGTKTPSPINISYICILVIPIKENAFGNGDTQKVYDFCEGVVNKYLNLYKLLPYFHHHDLVERNSTNSGAFAIIWKYRICPSVELVETSSLMLNMGHANLIRNQQPLDNGPLNLLLSGFGRDDWYEYQDVMSRLVRAYDFNCYGDADSAIIFSSSAVEGFLMVTELLIRVREKGQDYTNVLNRVKSKSLAQLALDANNLYGLNIDTSTQRTEYGKWHGRCYKRRNDIIHRQGLHTPYESRPAIDATASLMLHITNLVKRKYSKSAHLMSLIGAVAKGALTK